MKIYLLITILTFSIFASPVKQNYKQLNKEIDNISLNLTLEEKVALFFLISSTHENIVTALSLDETNISSLKKIEKRTLKVFSNLHKNNPNINIEQINKIKKLYINIVKDAYTLIKMQPHESKEKIIFKDKVIKESSFYINSFFIILGIFAGLILGFFIFKKTTAKEIKEINIIEEKNSNINVIRDLQKRNNDLKHTIASLKSDSILAAKVRNENITLRIQNKEQQSSSQLLQEKLNKKISTLDSEKNILLKELQANKEDKTYQAFDEQLESLQLQSHDIIIVLDSLIKRQSQQTDSNLLQPLTQQWLEDMVKALQIWQTKLESLHRQSV